MADAFSLLIKMP